MQNNSTTKKKSSSFKISAFDMFGSPVSFNIRGDDTYKTVLGCFWTLVVLFIVGASFLWYFRIYLDKTNVEVTSKTIIQSEYPKLNLTEKGYFFTLSANRENKIISMNKLNDILDFEVLQMEIISSKAEGGERSEPTINPPKLIRFDNCGKGPRNESKIDGHEYEGSDTLSTSNHSFCTLDDESGEEKVLYLQGNEDSDTFAFVKFRVMVCDKTEKECLFYYVNRKVDEEIQYKRLGMPKAVQIHGYDDVFSSPTGTCASPPSMKNKCMLAQNAITQYIQSSFKSVYFSFNYIEGAVRAENYTNPFSYSINSGIRISPAPSTQKIINIYFKEVVVETDVGKVLEDFEIQKSISYDSVFLDSLDRGDDAEVQEKRPGGATEIKIAPLIEIFLYSSNNQLVYTRKYSKIVDVFADVGGIAEVIGFIVIFLYAWYSGIRLEQKLLNYGVLNKSDLEEREVLISGYGQYSEKWEKSRYFSFCDLVKFGLAEKNILCCCGKNNKKYALYKKCKETLETRTDIINVMKSVAEVDTIKEAIFDDYQNRLTPYLVNEKEDDDSNLRSMTIESAIQQLKEKNDSNEKRPEIKKTLDLYLMKKLPREILEGEASKLGIEKGNSVIHPLKTRGHPKGFGRDSKSRLRGDENKARQRKLKNNGIKMNIGDNEDNGKDIEIVDFI